MRTHALLAILIALIAFSCGSDRQRPTASEPTSETGAVALKLAIPQALDVDRVEYIVSAADMDSLRGELTIGSDDVARGTVTGIQPGQERLFTLNAYDSDGLLTYSGSSTADVKAGQTTQVHIALRSLSGAADITGEFVEPSSSDSPLGHSLLGSWLLDLPVVSTDTFSFTYTFDENGRFTNRIGGEFLAPLQDIEELADIDLGGVDEFDGGLLVLQGNWTTAGDSLRLEFDRIAVELIGSLPLIGKLSIEVLSEELEDRVEFELGYTYSVSTDQLQLEGDSLTLGIDLDMPIDDVPVPEQLSAVGRQALSLLRNFLEGKIEEEDLNRFKLTKIE
jgi:hypothetical protein